MRQHRPHNLLRKTGSAVGEEADKPGSALTPVAHKLEHHFAEVIGEWADKLCKHLFLFARELKNL